MREIKRIIIHCSATDIPEQDNVEALRYLHTSKKSKPMLWGSYETNGKDYSDIGYHYFITKDGVLHECRPVEKQGAHCFGHNQDSVGVCLSGNLRFTPAQFITLRGLKDYLRIKHGYDIEFLGHCELNKGKSCPNFDVREIL